MLGIRATQGTTLRTIRPDRFEYDGDPLCDVPSRNGDLRCRCAWASRPTSRSPTITPRPGGASSRFRTHAWPGHAQPRPAVADKPTESGARAD
jgi:hypothetical protein